MTDLTPPERDQDALLLDALDGDPEALATVEGREHLAELLGQMRRNRLELRAAIVQIEPERRATSIDAAMVVFDNMVASASAAEALHAASQKRRRTQSLFRSLGVAAAGVAAVVAVVVVGPNLGSSDSADTATSDAAADTTAVAAASTTSAASGLAERSVADGARTENFSSEAPLAPTTVTAAPATTNAPATTIAATVPAPEEDELADSVSSLDNSIIECAAQTGRDVTAWIGSSPSDEPTEPEQSLMSFVVLTDGGFEIDVVLDIATCEFVSVGEPGVPAPGGQ